MSSPTTGLPPLLQSNKRSKCTPSTTLGKAHLHNAKIGSHLFISLWDSRFNSKKILTEDRWDILYGEGKARCLEANGSVALLMPNGQQLLTAEERRDTLEIVKQLTTQYHDVACSSPPLVQHGNFRRMLISKASLPKEACSILD
jgi:hypothetical protein